MKNLRIKILIIVILLTGCGEHASNSHNLRYSLVGKVNDWADGTKLYLLDISSSEIIDSTVVYKCSFSFEGYLQRSPINMALHTKDFSESKILWLENENMILDASKTSLRKGKVRGSKTHSEAEILFYQLDTLENYESEIQASMDFVAKYPGSRVSAAVLSGYSQNVEKTKVRELFDQLSEANKESIYGQKILKYLSLNKSHSIGAKYSDFEMKNPNDKSKKLSESMGKITLLEFWASWCGPCRQENPQLLEIYNKYKESGFQIFAVSLDFSKQNWLQAIKEDNLIWEHVSDLKGRNSTAGIIYGVNKIPDNFLIDEDGTIIGRGLWGEKLIKTIDSLLMH